MEQKIPISERAFKALLESKEELIEDAKSKNYNPFFPNPIMLSSPKWYKNITKLVVSSLVVFAFSPKGMFLDLKEGRIGFFIKKIILFFLFSIPLFLLFFSLCFFFILSVITPIITLILYLIS
jgi:hypothetical protein